MNIFEANTCKDQAKDNHVTGVAPLADAALCWAGYRKIYFIRQCFGALYSKDTQALDVSAIEFTMKLGAISNAGRFFV